MTMATAKTHSGGAAAAPVPVPRALSNIAASVALLALFLVAASVALLSHPFSSSLPGYLLGVDRYTEPQPPPSGASSPPVPTPPQADSSGAAPTPLTKAVPPSPPPPPSASAAVTGSTDGSDARVEEKATDDKDPDDPGQRQEEKYSGDENPAPLAGFQKNASESCDLFHGQWVYDPAGPLYTNNTCPLITQMQNCQGNGRPDKEYENWRWRPHQCSLPRFDGKKFLEMMRGKTLAFVGDSVARNQMESLLCILWQVETPKNRGNRRMQRWFFRSTSTFIVRIWSSWLVHKTNDPFQFAPKDLDKIHLDLPDESFMEFLPKFDVVVLSSGHWFAKRSAYILNNTIVGGQLWWPKDAPVSMQINNVDAFDLSVETALSAIASHPNFTGLAIVRSFSPDHYEGGAWNTGGSCTGKVRPATELVSNGFTDAMHGKQVSGFERAAGKAGNAASTLRLMDITEVFSYRPDGHPGPYRSPDPNKVTKRGPNGEPPPQDCLHWCMPGPIDTWNEMLMEMIRREFEGA